MKYVLFNIPNRGRAQGCARKNLGYVIVIVAILI